jgi:hypothetical protein
MEEIETHSNQSWLGLARFADGVVVCSDLEAVAPAYDERQKKPDCSVLPCGKDYLEGYLTRINCSNQWAGLVGLNQNIRGMAVYNLLYTANNNPDKIEPETDWLTFDEIFTELDPIRYE